jgi:hypothetical protein
MSSNELEMEDMFADVDQMEGAAQKIMQSMTPAPKQAIKSQPASQPAGVVSAPPSQAKQTEEDRAYQEYKKEKDEMCKLSGQLCKLANSDRNGEIVRNFGMSQLAIAIGGEITRINGMVILRALKAKCIMRDQDKKDSKVIRDHGGYQEEISQSLYEVWGEMEDGSLGLTSSYLPANVLSVIDLNSGYDISPDE